MDILVTVLFRGDWHVVVRWNVVASESWWLFCSGIGTFLSKIDLNWRDVFDLYTYSTRINDTPVSHRCSSLACPFHVLAIRVGSVVCSKWVVLCPFPFFRLLFCGYCLQFLSVSGLSFTLNLSCFSVAFVRNIVADVRICFPSSRIMSPEPQ